MAGAGNDGCDSVCSACAGSDGWDSETLSLRNGVSALFLVTFITSKALYIV